MVSLPGSLVFRGRDQRIYWAWLLGLLALAAFGVGTFTLNVVIFLAGVALAAVAVFLFRRGRRNVLK